MDLSLAADPYSTAYLGHAHHQYQQQQQQQQPQHNQQQQHHHLQYQYHQSQHPQTLSLAPPTGKGFYDLESLEHAGTFGTAPNGLGLGHLGASSSYQPDYGLSAYPGGAAAAPASSSAAGASFHHAMIPSHSPGQPWARNSNSTHTANVNAAQYPHISPIGAAATSATTATHILHPTGYNAEAHPLGSGASAGVDPSLQYSSLHGWGGSEAQRSQWSQQAWDNCLPPGVEPTASSVPNSVLPAHPPTHTQLQAHPHPHLQQYSQAHMHMYRHLQQFPSIGMNVWTAKPGPKVWPKKKPVKKLPAVKTTAMKETGAAARGRAPENKPGWCFVCQRNCVTEVALKQHLEGKGHKRQAELQKERAELAAKAVDADGGGVATMLEQMWVQVSMMGKSGRVGKTRKKPKAEGETRPKAEGEPRPKAEGEPREVKSTDIELKAEGELGEKEPTDVKPKAEERPTNSRSRRARAANPPKVQETVRCDVCGVECNTKAVLEIHFGGKKHAARLKKLQESDVPSNVEQNAAFLR